MTIQGQVQGVGFRYFVMHKAASYNISGFVKNQPDGSVYVEAEGEPEFLKVFIEACKSGPSHAWVENVVVQYCPVQDFEGFERR